MMDREHACRNNDRDGSCLSDEDPALRAPSREPEDGAVDDVQKRVERIVFEDFYGSPVAGSKERLAKALIHEFGLAALATREMSSADPCASHKAEDISLDPCCPTCEAPAEAGEARERIRASISDLQVEQEVMAGAFDPEKWSVDVKVTDLQAILRAQPQAREGEAVDRKSDGLAHLVAAISLLNRAEKIGKKPSMATGSKKMFDQMLRDYEGAANRMRKAIYTHPVAPSADKLRIAVEALEQVKERIKSWPIDDHETCVCGSTVDSHSIGSGHSPVSQGDHAISLMIESIDQTLEAVK